MANFTINSLSNGGVPATTDTFLKSDSAGGLTKVTAADLKKFITSGYQLLSSSTDMNDLVTSGNYYTWGGKPVNFPKIDLSFSYCYVTVEAGVDSIIHQYVKIGDTHRIYFRSRQGSPATWGTWSLIGGSVWLGADSVPRNSYSFTLDNGKSGQSFLILTPTAVYLLTDSLTLIPLTNTNITATATKSNNTITITFSTEIPNGIKVMGLL